MNSDPQLPSVLVIDDEPEILREVAAVLENAGYSCRCCTTEEEAIASAGYNPPDLIIVDTNLHGHSGLALCERIKEEPALKNVPVMFLSATQTPDIIRRSHVAGGAYSLRKPFAPEVLLELAANTLWVVPLVDSSASR
jgi:DNA-binding response OmpR family regulator